MPRELTVRYSELSCLQDCALKYKLQYASGLYVPPTKRLVLGSAYHALMQGHYESFRDDDTAKRPRSLDRARARASARLNGYAVGEGKKHIDPEMIEQLRWMYQGYVDRYGTEDEMDRFIVIDEKRIVPMMSHKGVKVSLQVTADLIGHHKVWDRWLLIDHKSASGRDASKDAVKKENQLDPQRALYSACYSMQGPKKGRIPIFAAYHNVVRTDKLKREMSIDERMARSPVFYNETELTAVWEEMKDVARHAVEIRLGTGRVYSSPDPNECSWKCSFTQIHLAARSSGRDPVDVAIKNYGVEQVPGWQPL